MDSLTFNFSQILSLSQGKDFSGSQAKTSV